MVQKEVLYSVVLKQATFEVLGEQHWKVQCSGDQPSCDETVKSLFMPLFHPAWTTDGPKCSCQTVLGVVCTVRLYL